MLEGLKKAIASGWIQRRISYYTILGIVVFCVIETWKFVYVAHTLGYSGQEVSMVLGAIWLPMSGLTAHIFGKHKDSESRRMTYDSRTTQNDHIS